MVRNETGIHTRFSLPFWLATVCSLSIGTCFYFGFQATTAKQTGKGKLPPVSRLRSATHGTSLHCDRINKVLLENGWIVASMARMNDFFFTDGGDVAKRQYTMVRRFSPNIGNLTLLFIVS